MLDPKIKGMSTRATNSKRIIKFLWDRFEFTLLERRLLRLFDRVGMHKSWWVQLVLNVLLVDKAPIGIAVSC